jgi:hypothetical protein
MANAPRLSVLLPVYNGGPYLKSAVESVLAQSFADFELIAIDDGSTDGSGAKLDEMRDATGDPRLHVVHQPNAGLATTLNRAVALARGEYLARQDADDVSLPQRFARQVAFLDAHPACALLGTAARIWAGDQETDRVLRHPCENGELQLRALFDSFFVHSSVMMRRAALDVAGAYPADPMRFPEDFDLWSRLARRFELANLPEVLQLYRELPGSISRSKEELLATRALDIALDNLDLLLAGGGFDRAVLRDLAAAARAADRFVSPGCDWRALGEALAMAGARLRERFPLEREAIGRGEASVRGLLRRVRLRRALGDGPLSRAVRRARRLFA